MDEFISELTKDFAQTIFKHDGKLYKFAMPQLIQNYPFGFNMYKKVQAFFRDAAMPRPIEYIVDVGACIGAFAVPYAFMWPTADILCIEPSKYNFPYLEYNIRQFPQISAIKVIASNVPGRMTIAAPTVLQKDHSQENHNGILSVYGKSNVCSESVRADTLDNLVDRPVDWLKIDVEGHESKVLKGAKRILKEDRPMLQVEVSQSNQDMAGYSAAHLMLDIMKHNYQAIGGFRNDIIFRPGPLL